MNARRQRVPYERRVSRMKPRIVGPGICIIVLCLSIVLVKLLLPSFPYRQSILLAGDPFAIASFSADRSRVVLATIPRDTDIPAVYGYGRYSLSSIERLDRLDNRRGNLLTHSTAHAFGVPLFWHVTVSPDAPKDSLQRLRSVFHWASIIDRVFNRIDTSIPFFTWISYVFAVQNLHTDSVETIDFGNALSPMPLPDGSTSTQLDESKLDFLFGQSFVDSGVRAEGHTVAVYNSTSIPQVAQRASRMMAYMGIQLVFVGNSESDLKECVVHGTPDVLRSTTAKFIRSYFHCRDDVTQSELGRNTGADIVVELGSEFAAIYK